MAASTERRRAEYLGVLGLEPGATLSEIKSAYKRQALQCHPDKNQDDPEATQKFQEVSEAYNNLIRAEGEDDDDDFDGFCENDDVLIHLLNMFMEMRQQRAYEERLFRGCRSNVRLVFTPFGPMMVEDYSDDEYYDNDYYEPPYRGGYESPSSSYSRASHSRTRAPKPATSRPSYDHNYNHRSQESQRAKGNKSSRTFSHVNHDVNHYRDSSEDRPTVNYEKKPAKKKKKPEPKPAPEPPKKLTKKQLLAEQKRREKEMAEIAENLAQQRAEKLEREKKRAEKERIKQQELKNSTGNPGLLRYQKGHDKELENAIKEQLLQSEKEAIEHEKLVKEASKETETKKSKSRRKREAKQRRMKGGIEKAPEPTCDQSKSKVAELAQMSAEEINHDDFFLDPAPQILKTTTSYHKPANININTNASRSPNRPSFRGRQFGSPQRNLYTSSPVRHHSPSQPRTGYPNYQPRFRSPGYTSAGRGHAYANQRFTAPPSPRRPFMPRPETVSQTHSPQRSKAPAVNSELSSNWPLPSTEVAAKPKQSTTPAGSKVNEHSNGTRNSAPWCFQDKPGFQKPNPPSAPQLEPVHNVWAERQSFLSACPKNAEEEEAMLKAALEMSQLEAERSESSDGKRQLIPGVCANPAMRDRVPDPWNLSDISSKDAPPPPPSASGYGGVGMDKLDSISTAAPPAGLEPSGGATSQHIAGNEWQLSCDEDDDDDDEEDDEEEEDDDEDDNADADSEEDGQTEEDRVTQPLHSGQSISDAGKKTGLDSPTSQSFRTSSRLPRDQRAQMGSDLSSSFDLTAVRQQGRKTSQDSGKATTTTTTTTSADRTFDLRQPMNNFSFLQPFTAATQSHHQPQATSSGARPKLPTPTAEVAPKVPAAKMESLSLSEDHSEMWDVDSDDDSVGKPGFTSSASLGLGIRPNLASVNPQAGSSAARQVSAPVRKVSPTENSQEEHARMQAADATAATAAAAAAAASNTSLPSIQNLSSFFSLATQAQQAQQTALLQQLFPIPGMMPMPQTTGTSAATASTGTAAGPAHATTTGTTTHQGTPQVPLFPSIPAYMPGAMPLMPNLFMPLLGQPNLGAFGVGAGAGAGAGAIPAGVGGGLGGLTGDANNNSNNVAGPPASSDTAGVNSVPSQWNK